MLSFIIRANGLVAHSIRISRIIETFVKMQKHVSRYRQKNSKIYVSLGFPQVEGNWKLVKFPVIPAQAAQGNKRISEKA